jgi:hypothetical protein
MKTPLDNPTLRELLDAVRPDSSDLDEPDLRAAAEAVESSPAWESLFEQQLAFDRSVARAMTDVPVPEGLKERLLGALAAAVPAAESGTSVSTAPSVTVVPTGGGSRPHRGVTRRHWGMAAASVLALVAMVWLAWPRNRQLLSLEEIRAAVPRPVDGRFDLAFLPGFDDNFQPGLPDRQWERVWMSEPLGLDWTGDGRHDGALLEFRTHGGQPVHGALLVVPVAAVADPPERTFLSTAGMVYAPTENTAWISADRALVYICFVGPGQLQRLQRQLYPQSA